jgi:hypothetical protein
MSVTETLEQIAGVDAATLEAMVGPDPHRPGRARYRLLAEQVPIWAIIGHIGAIAGTTEPEDIGPDTIAAVARERDISEAAVAAALHYYLCNRCPIDALLEENAAALEA